MSPEGPIVCLSISVSSSFIRNTSFFFNYSSITFSSTDFIDISKTRDQILQVDLFWISFWAVYLWYRAFAVQNLIIFDGYTHTRHTTHGHRGWGFVLWVFNKFLASGKRKNTCFFISTGEYCHKPDLKQFGYRRTIGEHLNPKKDPERLSENNRRTIGEHLKFWKRPRTDPICLVGEQINSNLNPFSSHKRHWFVK